MGKSIDYRKKMDDNRRLHIKRVRKIVISSAVASTLVFQPFIPVIENGKLIGFTEESASAATLAEVGILENIVIDAELSNVEGPGPYDLDLSLTGTGLATAELVNPATVALFNAPDLAGNIATAGPADIRIELLPITLDDLPALETLVTNLTGVLNPAVSGIVGSVDQLLGIVPEGVLNVQGLEELQNAVNALNNVNTALADVLVYEDQVNAEINPNGTITVDFSAGLDEYLDTTINAVVLDLLNDVIVASQALEVNLLEPVPLVGPLVNSLLNGILTAATETILPAVQTAVDNITNNVTDLTGELVAAQVIGLTQIELPTTINRVPEVSGEVLVSGAVVNLDANAAAIDATLLGQLTSSASVVIPELDTTAPVITPIDDTTALEDVLIDAIPVEVDEESTITVDGLPTGLAYDPDTDSIVGTPTVSDWGPLENARDFETTVTATDEAGNTSTELFTITVQRDTDGDGIPDVTDDDDDNDGVPDEEEIENGTDPKVDEFAPVITPINDTTALENEPIDAILVEVDEESTITVDGLPTGLTYDPETDSIVGTPTVSDWGALEDVRDFGTTVTATDEAGNTSTELFTITVQRDTDGDGDPDITDPDDDNDGVPDEEEIENGTDPKVDEFAPVITPIDDTTALEDVPIDAIPVEVDEESTITVDGLPTGLAYDTETDSIVGTPTVSDWGALEDFRDFETEVTATDEAGNTSTELFTITVQRDTDGDGDPDITDPDDDNDGVPDEEEIENGTDPKVDEFAPVITPIDDTTALENEPIDAILVEVDEESTITVDGLPAGLFYDSETDSIVGTPTVDDWATNEDEERLFKVTVTAEDEAGNVGTDVFDLIIQRDTDGDGIPDITDDDDDNDGVTDEVEEEVGTDPKDETDVPDFEAPDAAVVDEVTSEDTEIVGTAEPGAEVTVTFPNGETATDTADENGDFTILIPEEIDLTGGEQLEVVVEDEAGNVSEVTPIIVADTTAPIILEIDDQTVIEGNAIETIEVAVENPGAQQTLVQNRAVDLILPFATPLEDVIVTGLPEGTTYDPSTNTISGIPVIEDWEATEESRDFEITVLASDEAGNEATEVFTITVQRDTDGDGDPDVTDPDDDNDGITDEEEIENGTDPKNPDTLAPVITPVEDTTAIENEPIEEIIVEVTEPSTIIVDGLPVGLEYDSETGLINGTPTVSDWGETEESRDFKVIVVATDEAGNESTEVFVITIERDTDGDGDPDVTDPDDDNDGITDEEELENGTDPKDDMDPDTIAPVITPIEDRDAVENEPIEDIVVEVNEPSEVTVDGLPEGLEYDPETGLISGTPTVNDWGTNETEREFIITITAEDEAGNISTTGFSLVIQRDLDEDGIPDVMDPDDDNDGYTDEEEMQAGTNPMDGSNYPGNSSGFSTQNQEKLPQTGESQNIFKFVSGSVIAAVSALMLALNKKKKTSKKG